MICSHCCRAALWLLGVVCLFLQVVTIRRNPRQGGRIGQPPGSPGPARPAPNGFGIHNGQAPPLARAAGAAAAGPGRRRRRPRQGRQAPRRGDGAALSAGGAHPITPPKTGLGSWAAALLGDRFSDDGKGSIRGGCSRTARRATQGGRRGIAPTPQVITTAEREPTTLRTNPERRPQGPGTPLRPPQRCRRPPNPWRGLPEAYSSRSTKNRPRRGLGGRVGAWKVLSSAPLEPRGRYLAASKRRGGPGGPWCLGPASGLSPLLRTCSWFGFPCLRFLDITDTRQIPISAVVDRGCGSPMAHLRYSCHTPEPAPPLASFRLLRRATAMV